MVPERVPSWYLNYIRSFDQLPDQEELDQGVQEQQQPEPGQPLPPMNNLRIGHLPLPELDPDPDILLVAESTSNCWRMKKARRDLREFDVPKYIYVRPESNVVLFNEQFPLPNHLLNKSKDGVRLWPTKNVVIKKPIPNEP